MTFLASACAQVGLDPTGARLIKFTNNAVYRLATQPFVVRIAGSAVARGRVDKVITVARWLAAGDAPAIRLVETLPQPIAVGGELATVWHAVEAVREPTGTDLARILAAVHALAPIALPPWQPLTPIRARIAHAGPDDAAFLSARADAVERQLATVVYHRPRGPIHGDAFLGNVIAGTGGAVICDFDSSCDGPREWDLIPMAVGRLRFGRAVDPLADATGVDITAWGGFAVLRELRELQLVTSVIPVLATNPALRPQWEHRMHTLRSGDPAPWQPY